MYFQFHHQNHLLLWLTSCSICCGHIRHTDHINCIDPTALWQLLKRHHIWFPLEYTTSLTHTCMYIQAADSFDLYYASWRADESFSLPVRMCISATGSCVVFYALSIQPSYAHLRKEALPQGGDQWTAVLCSASVGSYLEGLQVGRISGAHKKRGRASIHYLFPHLTLAAGSSPIFICSKSSGVWG